jgi:hypothetical protein
MMTTPLEQQEESVPSKTQAEKNPTARLKNLHPTLNAIIVVFGIIMVWRGVWALLDIHLFPGYPTFSALVSIALGALVLYLDDFSLKDLKR